MISQSYTFYPWTKDNGISVPTIPFYLSQSKYTLSSPSPIPIRLHLLLSADFLQMHEAADGRREAVTGICLSIAHLSENLLPRVTNHRTSQNTEASKCTSKAQTFMPWVGFLVADTWLSHRGSQSSEREANRSCPSPSALPLSSRELYSGGKEGRKRSTR